LLLLLRKAFSILLFHCQTALPFHYGFSSPDTVTSDCNTWDYRSQTKLGDTSFHVSTLLQVIPLKTMQYLFINHNYLPDMLILCSDVYAIYVIYNSTCSDVRHQYLCMFQVVLSAGDPVKFDDGVSNAFSTAAKIYQ